MEVHWMKCKQQGDGNNINCRLNSLNLSHEYWDQTPFGVYIIWKKTNFSVVKVGQGNIHERLMKHKIDKEIQQYAKDGLYVTWATVSENDVDGVEGYLGNLYAPLIGDRFPDAEPIEVNLPQIN